MIHRCLEYADEVIIFRRPNTLPCASRGILGPDRVIRAGHLERRMRTEREPWNPRVP